MVLPEVFHQTALRDHGREARVRAQSDRLLLLAAGAARENPEIAPSHWPSPRSR